MSFRLKRLLHNKVNLLVMVFTLGITAYGFEIYLYFSHVGIETQRALIAKQIGIPFDKRSKIEALKDLRDSGVEAFPNLLPKYYTESNGLNSNDGRIYPLGTISNSTTIFNNESGYYPIIETDEHGFNNPKGLYIENDLDIILIGDSFTAGHSVHANENLSGLFRRSGFKSISVGKAANGSLIELATLKEYAEPLKPKIVLWLYYVNDLDGLKYEMKSSILQMYLNDEDFSQNLISRQKEIDSVLMNYVQVQQIDKAEKEIMLLKKSDVEKIIKLYHLRNRINLISSEPNITPTVKSTFRDILSKSKQIVSGWDGKMYFVYLPPFKRYSNGNEDLNRNFVMRVATELDIPIIDIQKEVFDSHPDPLSLFPLRLYGHYNAKGYRFVVEAIEKRLETDGYVKVTLKN